MAPISPPTWMQAGSYSARNDRLLLASLLGYPGFTVDEATPLRIRQGVKPSYQNYQLKVRAAGTPNMTVIVSAGFVWIDNHDLAGYGAYACENDADYTINVPAAGGAGQYRKDTIVASVYDAETAGATNEFRIELIQGPYAASAGATVRGTLPSNAQVLADIAIAPSQTSVSSGNITDVRNYAVAAGGIVPISSSNDMNHPHPGQVRYRTDTDTFVYGKADGTTAVLLDSSGASTIGKTQFKYKTANLARATATATDDPDLTFTVEANAVYEVSSTLFYYTTDETNADLNLDWTVPAGAGGRWAGFGQGGGSPSANAGLMRTVSTVIDGARSYDALADSVNPLAMYSRHLLTTVSGGTFALAWARTGGSGTVTLLANSHVSVTRRA